MPAPSAISLLVPRLKGLLIFPGTASTSLPCSSSYGVISDPLVSPLHDCYDFDNAEIILFLMEISTASRFCSGGYSDTMSPLSHIVL